MTFHVVIPARWAASRLPGKPLRVLAGRPMIEHVWRRGVESGAASVTVATDDDRIRAAVEAFGGDARMTSTDHASGTDRIAEVVARAGWADREIVVNLQGDEPCMDPAAIRTVAALLEAREDAGVSTLATPIRAPGELFDPSVVKVVLDDSGLARWFSRAPIPWVRGVFDHGAQASLPQGVPFLRHLGIYAYRVGILRRLSAMAPVAHERAESLEQLRALATGIPIAVAVVDEAPGPGVDTEADVARADAELARRAAMLR